jgi:hypothetical protein
MPWLAMPPRIPPDLKRFRHGRNNPSPGGMSERRSGKPPSVFQTATSIETQIKTAGSAAAHIFSCPVRKISAWSNAEKTRRPRNDDRFS